MTKQRYRIAIAYDGSAYSGWQVQPRHVTVQGELERALHELSGGKVRVESSGRTDSGVHAREQVAHFDLPDDAFRPDKLLIGMNALLQSDIRVLSLRRASPDFHARFSAKGKEYRYFISNGKVLSPFHRRYRTWIREPLDISAMQRAAAHLRGRHDFAAFAANPNREVEGTVRHLFRLTVTQKGTEFVIRAAANGFMYKMVRSLAGFLIRIGRGEVPPEMAKAILESRLRTARVPTAPPEGLFLWRVYYNKVPHS
jgi:tRNA pseudouridine38-40 synthase